MSNDYNDAREACRACRDFPKISLGQEVLTGKGIGIVVGLEMPTNGLYLSPLKSKVLVWFGVDRAHGTENVPGNGGVVQWEFSTSDVTPLERSDWIPVIPEGLHGLPVLVSPEEDVEHQRRLIG